MEDNKKKGFGMVLEGGGMRGLYTAGVLDELMEQGIYADSTVGRFPQVQFSDATTSPARSDELSRYNTRFCKDERYMGLKCWLKTGDVYSRDFAYGEVPWKLDVFDTETYAKSPMRFTVVCTDLENGKPVYHECRKGDKADVEWMRASASIPLAAVPVKLDGKLYLDGGISDSIPVNWMLAQGYEKT
ncbi:MAG: patatin family protein [Blautia wexlerae]